MDPKTAKITLHLDIELKNHQMLAIEEMMNDYVEHLRTENVRCFFDLDEEERPEVFN